MGLRLLLARWTWWIPLVLAPCSLAAQAPRDPDSVAILRALATARDAVRIPLLLQLASARREAPAAMLALADSALGALGRYPSPNLETAARVARSHALNGLSRYPEAITESRQAERLSRTAGTDSLLIDALIELGAAELSKSEWAEALEHAEEARAVARPGGSSRRLSLTYALVGRIRNAMGDLKESLEAHLESLRISEATGDLHGIGAAHNNIAGVYWDLGQFEESLHALQKAREMDERLGARQKLAGVLNNIGLLLQKLDRSRESIAYLERGLELARTLGDVDVQAACLSNLGWAYHRLGEPDRALTFHREALALEEKISRRDAVVRSRGAIATVMIGRKAYRDAIPLLESAVALADTIKDPLDQVEMLEELSRLQALTGDTAAALLTHRRFATVRQALDDTTAARHVADLEASYRARERDRDLAAARTLAGARRTQVVWLMAGSLLLATTLAGLAVLYARQGRARRELAESEQRYRALFQNPVVPTFLIDRESRTILDLNNPARALCGLATPAPPGPIDALPSASVRGALEHLLAAPEADDVALDESWTIPSGERRWMEVRASTVPAAGRSCQLVTMRDTTDRHAQEEARQREDKMRSLGVLAGGIAHDFNNALTAVVGHLTLARDAAPGERDDLLDQAESAALGTRGLTSQLLAFARGGQPVRQPSDLGRLVRDAVAMAGAGSHLRVEVDLPTDLWVVSVDRSQFSQVVSAIVINAHQATGDGGVLRIRASNTREAPVPVGGPGEPRFVRIDFTDNGPGIPAEIRDRIFEPYFTTRSGGRGLGLATAFTICRNHGGALRFESEPGSGATFSAFFPATDERVAEPAGPTSADPSGGSRILVLDDEPMIRQILLRSLTKWGYEADAVADGREAVARYVEGLRTGRRYDLLVMDLTIPGGMGGRAAMAEIRSHDAEARAIVISGYSDDPTMANYSEAGFQAAIPKPFQLGELARIIAGVLGRTGPVARQ